MLTITKIFHFEMAHAVYGYPGACKNIHGHSYELHVTVTKLKESEDFIPAPGFFIDFKELKQLVTAEVIQTFDHKLVLSQAYLVENSAAELQENLVTWEVEPTAENLLLYIKQQLLSKLPAEVKLAHLKLFETKNSYADWINDHIFTRQ